MKIKYKILRKIRKGDRVTLIEKFKEEEYVKGCDINVGEIFKVRETRENGNELAFKEQKVIYWQNIKHYRLVTE